MSPVNSCRVNHEWHTSKTNQSVAESIMDDTHLRQINQLLSPSRMTHIWDKSISCWVHHQWHTSEINQLETSDRNEPIQCWQHFNEDLQHLNPSADVNQLHNSLLPKKIGSQQQLIQLWITLRCWVYNISWQNHDMESNTFHFTGLSGGNPPVRGGFPSQRASNAELWCFLSLQPGQVVE